MQVIDVVKELIKMGLTGVSLEWDKERELFYYDLNTRAKSHLYLFDDFHVEGRYEYTSQIDIEDWHGPKDIMIKLFWEFMDQLCGRDFYNPEWMEIGVQLGLVEKKVQTHTTVTYE